MVGAFEVPSPREFRAVYADKSVSIVETLFLKVERRTRQTKFYLERYASDPQAIPSPLDSRTDRIGPALVIDMKDRRVRVSLYAQYP
jgi:hypothetical protein